MACLKYLPKKNCDNGSINMRTYEKYENEAYRFTDFSIFLVSKPTLMTFST